ncbi:Ras family protein, partial [Oesophagostomum dentatum]
MYIIIRSSLGPKIIACVRGFAGIKYSAKATEYGHYWFFPSSDANGPVHAYCEAPDIIICGNKADLENRRQVSTARAKQLADQLGLPYFETSACTSTNVERAVDCLLDLVMQRIQQSVETSGLPLS